jgi:hypothetical protein
VQWLFLDLNAFFASCEQQENPALRGQPVIVVQTLTDSAVAIAASYAAKAFGGIVTETGSGANGVSDRMTPWLRSATAAIASRPRSSSRRFGGISASP